MWAEGKLFELEYNLNKVFSAYEMGIRMEVKRVLYFRKCGEEYVCHVCPFSKLAYQILSDLSVAKDRKECEDKMYVLSARAVTHSLRSSPPPDLGWVMKVR